MTVEAILSLDTVHFNCTQCHKDFVRCFDAAEHVKASHKGMTVITSEGESALQCEQCHTKSLKDLKEIMRGDGTFNIACQPCIAKGGEWLRGNKVTFRKDTDEKAANFIQIEAFYQSKVLRCAKCHGQDDLKLCQDAIVRCEKCISNDSILSKGEVVPGGCVQFAHALVEGNSRKNYKLSSIDPERVVILKRVRNLILKTTAGVGPSKFKKMSSYMRNTCYNLFLEESVETPWLRKATIHDGKSWGQFKMVTSLTKSWALVPGFMREMSDTPFLHNQCILVMQDEDADFVSDKRPKICAFTVYICKVKADKVYTDLRLYHWNTSTLPESMGSAAIMPCSIRTSRVLYAGEIFNSSFDNLILQNDMDILFPEEIKGDENAFSFEGPSKIEFVSKLNDSQKSAVISALNDKIACIRGPPGSGKTATIHEMILQFLQRDTHGPIVVCAESNLAVDNITEIMAKTHANVILRVVSTAKEAEYGKENPLHDVCLHNQVFDVLPEDLRERYILHKKKRLPKKQYANLMRETAGYGTEIIKRAKVIFCTTVGVASFYMRRLDSIPVVIMDEATQTSEPTCLIPLAAKGLKKVIFVGDEAQLSCFTHVRSLEVSLFEKCLINKVFTHPIMLDTQYRMHPEISEFPRKKFYNGLLKDGISAEDRKHAAVKYPLFFLDHSGDDSTVEKVEDKAIFPSTFNNYEVLVVVKMVEMLLKKGISPKNIGVMTGYSAQRRLIADALSASNLLQFQNKGKKNVEFQDIEYEQTSTVRVVSGIIVATMQAFQGRERDFIILSCVRSNDEAKVGYLSDQRRMNVALTRARCSLLFTGDADSLSSGSILWREYIQYLRDKGRIFTKLEDY